MPSPSSLTETLCEGAQYWNQPNAKVNRGATSTSWASLRRKRCEFKLCGFFELWLETLQCTTPVICKSRVTIPISRALHGINLPERHPTRHSKATYLTADINSRGSHTLIWELLSVNRQERYNHSISHQHTLWSHIFAWVIVQQMTERDNKRPTVQTRPLTTSRCWANGTSDSYPRLRTRIWSPPVYSFFDSAPQTGSWAVGVNFLLLLSQYTPDSTRFQQN